MKRQLALIQFALGSAHRRSGRTLSLVAALALVTFSYASVLFLTEALRREFRMAALVASVMQGIGFDLDRIPRAVREHADRDGLRALGGVALLFGLGGCHGGEFPRLVLREVAGRMPAPPE